MSTNPDIYSFNALKEASLWLIIATVIGFVGIVYSLAEIAAIVSFILIFFFALPQLKKAFQGFLQTGKNVGNGITGANILTWAYLLVFIGGIIVVTRNFVTNSALGELENAMLILAALLELVAGILIGLAVYNLGRFYASDMMWVSGILIIIPGINFIGWILLYISIDDIVNKLTGRSMPMQPGYQQPYSPQQGYQSPPQPMQPTYQPYQPTPQPIIVYQTGNGQLTEDGKAVFSLYSNGQIQIMSAKIDNTTIAVDPDKIMPQVLASGNNTVTIQFPPIANLGFIKQNVYTITLTLSDGHSVKVYVTYT